MITIPDNIELLINGQFPEIVIDNDKIGHIFQNLIENAIKFNDKANGIITIQCVDKHDEWQFEISDNGPGIEKKYHNKIFDIFQTLSVSSNNESTGIGLSIVKKIIEFYGGKIWIESELGKGSIFRFTILKNIDPQMHNTISK
jgi:signal transduction histidine kinase